MLLAGQAIEALAAKLAAGETTSRELVEAALEAIARDGRAFAKVYAEQSRAAAERSD